LARHPACVFSERTKPDPEASEGNVIDGNGSIESFGSTLFEHLRRIPGVEMRPRVEQNKHRDFFFGQN
jgi:hypothetical protein